MNRYFILKDRWITNKDMMISRIYKELKQVYKEKTNKPIQKWAKNMNRQFTKEDIHEANKHKKMLIITGH